jgi:hypothetical protein
MNCTATFRTHFTNSSIVFGKRLEYDYFDEVNISLALFYSYFNIVVSCLLGSLLGIFLIMWRVRINLCALSPILSSDWCVLSQPCARCRACSYGEKMFVLYRFLSA